MAKRSISFEEINVGMKLTANMWFGSPMRVIEKRDNEIVACVVDRTFSIGLASVEDWKWFEVETAVGGRVG